MWSNEQRKKHKPRGGRYPSDVNDEEWTIIEPMIPVARTGGRKRETDTREVFNAIRYIDRTGCQWRHCQKTFLRIRQSISTSGNGRATACSIGFTKPCLRDAGRPAGARATPQRRSSTRRLRKRPKKGGLH
jgi:transposase